MSNNKSLRDLVEEWYNQASIEEREREHDLAIACLLYYKKLGLLDERFLSCETRQELHDAMDKCVASERSEDK